MNSSFTVEIVGKYSDAALQAFFHVGRCNGVGKGLVLSSRSSTFDFAFCGGYDYRFGDWNLYGNKNIIMDWIYDNGYRYVYANNTLIGQQSSDPMTVEYNFFILGKHIGSSDDVTTSGGWSVDGKYYAIRVYNRRLSTSEIQYNYNIDKERFNI